MKKNSFFFLLKVTRNVELFGVEGDHSLESSLLSKKTLQVFYTKQNMGKVTKKKRKQNWRSSTCFSILPLFLSHQFFTHRT